MTPKHQKIADEINKAFEKMANCDHSFKLVIQHGQLFQRCEKCNAMRKWEGKK